MKGILITVMYFKLGGHLTCGREGKTLKTSTDSGEVICRNCRHTDAYVEARQAKTGAGTTLAQPSGNWRDSWGVRLLSMPGPQHLLRGFNSQQFV
jgi:hypothetical protein